jgi:DNA repair protein RadC
VLFARNARQEVYAHELVALGAQNVAWVRPRDVFRAALHLDALDCYLAHNHPSGCTTPSEADIALHDLLTKQGRELGLPVRDHLILGQRGWESVNRAHGEWPTDAIIDPSLQKG